MADRGKQLLADEGAFARATKLVVARQPDPETLSDPKPRFERICASCGAVGTGAYDRVALQADLAIIEQRCAQGFGRFASQLRQRAT